MLLTYGNVTGSFELVFQLLLVCLSSAQIGSKGWAGLAGARDAPHCWRTGVVAAPVLCAAFSPGVTAKNGHNLLCHPIKY